jgi:hypothetical protein
MFQAPVNSKSAAARLKNHFGDVDEVLFHDVVKILERIF